MTYADCKILEMRDLRADRQPGIVEYHLDADDVLMLMRFLCIFF